MIDISGGLALGKPSLSRPENENLNKEELKVNIQLFVLCSFTQFLSFDSIAKRALYAMVNKPEFLLNKNK